ncbi:MAG: FAD-dependent monooxygenase [Proteobacteria bacterium]|nr:FAD-dependent monooxygenase [Pseudomonadota bacterium]
MQQATSAQLRIGIVGAGTAGLATAIAFARSGHHVQVFEKHPSLATLGAGLLIQPQGVRALSELGVRDEFNAASVPIDRLLGKNQRGWRLVDVAYPEHHARAVSRSALAHLLLRAALAAGVEVRFNTPIEQVETDGKLGCIRSASERMPFDLVVIADGASSVLPAQVGLAVPSSLYKWGALWAMVDVDHWPHARVLQQRFRTTRQMFGLMPTERRGDKLRLSLFWSLPCAAYPAWKASSLDAWKAQLLDLWPESAPAVEQIHAHDQLTFATYHHAWPRRLANPPICIVGDAAHAMSPQLGLGATLAVQDALLLAQHVNARGVAAGTLSFAKKRLPAVRAYQALSRTLTPCFQADGGGLWRDLLFAAGLHIPGVPWLMHRSIAEPQPRARLAVEEPDCA